MAQVSSRKAGQGHLTMDRHAIVKVTGAKAFHTQAALVGTHPATSGYTNSKG